MEEDVSVLNERKTRFRRPEWNKAVKLNLLITECLLDALKEGAKKGAYLNEKEFAISILRGEVERIGLKRFRDPP